MLSHNPRPTTTAAYRRLLTRRSPNTTLNYFSSSSSSSHNCSSCSNSRTRYSSSRQGNVFINYSRGSRLLFLSSHHCMTMCLTSFPRPFRLRSSAVKLADRSHQSRPNRRFKGTNPHPLSFMGCLRQVSHPPIASYSYKSLIRHARLILGAPGSTNFRIRLSNDTSLHGRTTRELS